MIQRRLAAIMFTDIVGYTALMGQDEHHAMKVVHKSIEIQKPLVEKHHGKWLKEMGDGTMAQFASAMDAVNCAIEIQKESGFNLQAQLRIGIHLGDITIEDDEIYGDGVNIASRIESAADPGSVFISEAVYIAIKGISGIQAKHQGRRKLKNVADPVRIYKIISGEGTDSRAERFLSKYVIPAILVFAIVVIGIWRSTHWFSGISDKTIMVLPMELSIEDSSSQYIVRSITRELIGSLGKVSELSVINPYSTNFFEGSSEPISEARNQLHLIDYYIRGSVDLKGIVLALDIGLLDREENEIWSNSYQHDLTFLPELSGRIVLDIAKFLGIKLNSADYQRITELKRIDPEIYELWDKGIHQLNKGTERSLIQAHMFFSEAVDRSPADARTVTKLAVVKVIMGNGDEPPDGIWQEGKALALQALHLDSLNAEAWAALAHVKTSFEWKYMEAEYAYEKANELNPSIAKNHFNYSRHLYLHDQLDRAIQEAINAQELDPMQENYSVWLAVLYAEKGEFEKAFEVLDRSARQVGESRSILQRRGDVYLEMGRYDSARYFYEKGRYNPGIAIAHFRKGDYDKGMEVLEHILSYPLNSFQAFNLAQIYAEIDSLDRFFEYAEYQPPYVFTPWLRKLVSNPKIIRDPRYGKFIRRMNLPMPQGYK